MYVLNLDQRHSRESADGVPAMFDRLGAIRTVLGFERTIGDEIQGLLDDPGELVAAVLQAGLDGNWHIGIGIGVVDEPLPERSTAARGEAYYAARRAIDRAKTAPAGLVVSAGTTPPGGPAADDRAPDDRTEAVRLAEAALRLLLRVITDISPRSRRYVDYVLDHPGATQSTIASHFDVTQQAVSKALSRGSVDIVAAGRDLCVHQLELTHAEPASVLERGRREEGRP